MKKSALRRRVDCVSGRVWGGSQAWCTTLVETARKEHTLVNLIKPPDNEEGLLPTQMVQVLWNTLAFELFITCFMFQGDTSEPETAGSPRDPHAAARDSLSSSSAFVSTSTFTIAPITAITNGAIASLSAFGVISIFTYVFRLGSHHP